MHQNNQKNMDEVFGKLWNDTRYLQVSLDEFMERDFQREEEIYLVSIVNCLIDEQRINYSPVPKTCVLHSGEDISYDFMGETLNIIEKVKNRYKQKSQLLSKKGINLSKNSRQVYENQEGLVKKIEVEIYDLLAKRSLVAVYLSSAYDFSALLKRVHYFIPEYRKNLLKKELNCPICFSELESGEEVNYYHTLFGLHEHGIHIECFQDFLKNYHTSIKGMPTCPYDGCQQKVEFRHLFKSLKKYEIQNIESIIRKILNSYLEKQGSIFQCPDDNCPGNVSCDRGKNRECNICGKKPCVRCQTYHPPNLPCLETKEGSNKNPFRRLNIQYCPQCRAPTERTEGCNHMSCPCGYHWHFNNQEEWQGYGQGDVYTWGGRWWFGR